MSRNVRQKFPATPVKATKRVGSRSSSPDLSSSDEDGYSGVEDVSESEDDDVDVVAAEEKYILRESSTRPLIFEDDNDADEEGDDDDEAEDDEVIGDNTSWDGILESEQDEAVPEDESDGIDREPMSSERRVRFTGVPDSDSDSTTSDVSETENFGDFFPDIFVDQNALDPHFRREIEKDQDDSSSTSSTHWVEQVHVLEALDEEEDDDEDVTPTVTPTATPAPSAVPAEASSPSPVGDGPEDGYESDGDTTEEDEPEPPIRQKQMRRFPAPDPDTDSDTETATPFRRGKPRVGRFNLDKSEKKPIAVLNPTTRRMMIFTPERVGRFDLSPEQFDLGFPSALPAGMPFFLPGISVMMDNMLSNSSFGDHLFNTSPLRPTEAFFPTSDTGYEECSDESEFPTTGGEDDGEADLRIEDFIQFGESDEEDNVGFWNPEMASSPSRPTTAASGADAVPDSPAMELLKHFDNNSDLVGAFRRNQVNQQLILSDKASQESLAFANPYHHGTLRGIKAGSIETVTTPITPARRHKRANAFNVQGIENLNSAQKRKAPSSFTDSLHKKQRSISDMDTLQI
ncbi:hypothetical protein QBC47DRAFT_405207 [Echria macrotheca]|uniref:Uncharacterized protein n=1 Tax=Echria macrotheca TaxID=438768 RepID=A0AAJ0B5E3_9PEZI|nr:hypothetical protein QBC47DRAFT_405207 [Echria macrotheca]